jgi:hypothetical protein
MGLIDARELTATRVGADAALIAILSGQTSERGQPIGDSRQHAGLPRGWLFHFKNRGRAGRRQA